MEGYRRYIPLLLFRRGEAANEEDQSHRSEFRSFSISERDLFVVVRLFEAILLVRLLELGISSGFRL